MAKCSCSAHNTFLTAKGHREAVAAQRSDSSFVFDGMAARRYLDRVGSVSASVEVEDDFDYDPKHVELNLGFARLLQLEIYNG